MTIRDAEMIEGGAEALAKVLAFLQKFEKSLEAEGEYKVQLVQCAAGGEMGVSEEVYDFTIPLEEFVKDIIDAAEQDALELRKPRVKYAVRVVGKNARSTFALTMNEDEADDIDDLDEGPTKRGLIGQQMEHNQVFAGMLVKQAKANLDDKDRTIRRLEQENDKLRRREQETSKMLEELRSMQFARDLEIMKLHKGEQRKDQVANILMQGAPVLLAKLLGPGGPAAGLMGGGGPPSPAGGATPGGGGGGGQLHPLELMLEGFVASFTKDQLEKIMTSGIFNPMQIATFMEILQYVVTQSDARKAAAAGQGQGSPPPTPGSHEAPHVPPPPT